MQESDQEDDEQITSSAAGIDGQTSQQANSKKPKPTASSVTGAKVQASSGSRSGSPAPRSATASHPGSPVATSVGTKRKADDEGGPSGKPHKREKSAAAPQTPADADAVKQVLTEQTVIRFVREAASPSEATAKNVGTSIYIRHKHTLTMTCSSSGLSNTSLASIPEALVCPTFCKLSSERHVH